jgi:hypothetical protein
MELNLSRVEGQDGTVCASSLSAMDRETNGIMEGNTKSRVGFFSAYTAVEQISLQEVNHGEHRYKK